MEADTAAAKTIALYVNLHLNRRTRFHQTPIVQPGQRIEPGQPLAQGNCTNDKGETSRVSQRLEQLEPDVADAIERHPTRWLGKYSTPKTPVVVPLCVDAPHRDADVVERTRLGSGAAGSPRSLRAATPREGRGALRPDCIPVEATPL